MRSAILFLAFNRLEFTAKALHRLLSVRHPHRLVIADNGSVDGTREFLASLQASGVDAEFVFYRRNYGRDRPRAHFMSRYAERFEFLGSVNNDVLVGLDWIRDFEEVLDRVPKAGIVGPVDRDWGDNNLAVAKGGARHYEDLRYYGGHNFNWSDAYWLMRSSVIPELRKQSSVKWVDGTERGFTHPGYPFFNSFSRTQEWYWSTMRDAGYVTACDPRHRMPFVYDVQRTDAKWHKRYAILSKIFSCLDARKYADETGGPMEYEVDGIPGAWEDEPSLVRRAPDWFLDSKDVGLTAQLDTGVTEADMAMLTPEQWRTMTFEDAFRG
jgi:hypothetical protein